jgi:hypothetical protein
MRMATGSESGFTAQADAFWPAASEMGPEAKCIWTWYRTVACAGAARNPVEAAAMRMIGRDLKLELFIFAPLV